MSKDSDWSWAYEHEDEFTSTRVSDARVLASDDEPQEKGNFSRCAACRKNNTIVIFHKSGANRDGLVIEEELLCKDCGKYTQFYFDDRG